MPQTGPAPAVSFLELGVSKIMLTPWVAGSSYDSLIASAVWSVANLPQTLSIDDKEKSAAAFGGESRFRQGTYSYETDYMTKFEYESGTLAIPYIVLNGTLITVPGSTYVNQVFNERQYFSPNYTDRPLYFTLVGESTFGDPGTLYVFPKCHVETGIQNNLDRTKPTVKTVDCVLNWDKTWVRQDGATGAIIEETFVGGGAAQLPSS